jgi:transposase
VLHRWRDEAVRTGRTITRIAVAFEAGRDGFWLARWLEARGVEAHVIHPSSVAVSREHRRAKTDRLDTELLKRGFLGWLRGERGHCSMARVPTIAEEDAKRPNRERECLVGERTRVVNRIKATLARLGIRGNLWPRRDLGRNARGFSAVERGFPARGEGWQHPRADACPGRLTFAAPGTPSGEPINVGQMYTLFAQAIRDRESHQPTFHHRVTEHPAGSR